MWRWSCLALILAACEPSPTPAAPPDPAEIEETVRAEQSAMTLSVRRVAQPGWSGRLVVASFSPGAGRHARVLPSERPRPLSEIVAAASPPQPFAAIDGGFYDTQSRPMGLVRAGGADHAPITDEGGSGVFVVEADEPRIVHRDAYASRDAVSEALQSIDRLVGGGASLVSPEASDRRAARSAVAIDAAGAVHLVVAFADEAVARESETRIELGSQATRTGPTIRQLAELLLRPASDGGVGAVDALGLDGGFSTSMTVKSQARSLSVVAYRATINGLLVAAPPG